MRSAGGASIEHNDKSDGVVSQYTGASPYLLTSRKFFEFVKENSNNPKPTDKIIYVAGTFDLFHVGHLDFLEQAKSLGDYLIVGLHNDDHAIMTPNERAMNVLSYRCVDEVLLEAPHRITVDLMNELRVGMVYHGRFFDSNDDRYEIPKRMGKFGTIDSGSDVTTAGIIERVRKHDEQYRMANKLKEAMEVRYQ